ncbi:hypothetical protein LTR36_003447 [Oleoguttula mirabilis]|uniref:Uncharacterized protein n=1 Tax=Oleoguttula mirabilis TaxID=1507867 RepID=A0AAV9JJ92_9PEZI|nr:hypothetical protein LTR36_003447 [Oleoguttula mirabilis]
MGRLIDNLRAGEAIKDGQIELYRQLVAALDTVIDDESADNKRQVIAQRRPIITQPAQSTKHEDRR